MTWVYIKSEPNLWTVGFYRPDGEWEAESDFNSTEAAAARCHYLNGGSHGQKTRCSDSEREAEINEYEMWGPSGRPI